MALEPGTLTAPQPVEPVRQYSFTDWQVNNPTQPPPGDRLDAEFDRANGAIGDVIDWTATSLNSDGTLRPGVVSQTVLEAGLFDELTADLQAEIQPLVDDATTAATSAFASAGTADTASGHAQTASGQAAASAAGAATSATNAATFAATATTKATDATNAASAAANSANHAAGDSALSLDWGQVSIAWAEHMPDPIPPNILATAGVTGNHWSSRWWANRSQELGQEVLDQINRIYLGAFPAPPIHLDPGLGALYFDLTLDAMYVWNGNAWQPVTKPGPVRTFRYVYIATAGQTVFSGPDRDGNALALDVSAYQQAAVFQKGLALTPGTAYATGASQITLAVGAAAGDVVQVWVESVPTVTLVWQTRRLKTSGWALDGVRTAFPLVDPTDTALVMSAASDVMLSLDGVWQQAGVDYTVVSSTLTFATAPPADSVVFGIAVTPVPDTPSPQPGLKSLNTSGWVLDGVAVNFPLVDAGGNALSPAAPENLLVSVNGVWQAANRDYTVAGSVLTFLTAPEPGSAAFGVVGLPTPSP